MILRLGTVFSGIGSIEQALLRLNYNYEIVFACDNGDVNINVDTENLLKKVKSLNSIFEKRDYVNNLYEKLTKKTNFVKKSYLANYKVKDDLFFNDIKLFDGEYFKNKIDLFVGGSPCQSFSIAGQRGGFEDTRGTLFYDFVRLVCEIKPKVFIFENVFGVLNHDGGKTRRIMQKSFREIGYYFKWSILDSKNYGIPQGRRRLFVVGFKEKKYCEKFKFPSEKPLKFKMQDFLLDNCAEGNYTVNNKGDIVLKPGGKKVTKYLSDKLVKYVMNPGTKNFYHTDAQIDLPIARAILSTQGNTHRASVNNYVTTDGHIRALEPRESLRLMGFPDTFKIAVSRAQSYKQSGNSIVVDVLMSLVQSIYEALGEKNEENIS